MQCWILDRERERGPGVLFDSLTAHAAVRVIAYLAGGVHAVARGK
jgi:hypothetical protein